MRGYRQTLGDKFSEGSRQMWTQIEKRGWSMADLTRAMNWAPGMAYRYLFGDRRPDHLMTLRIEAVLGIAPKSFLEPPKRKFAPPAARAA